MLGTISALTLLSPPTSHQNAGLTMENTAIWWPLFDFFSVLPSFTLLLSFLHPVTEISYRSFGSSRWKLNCTLCQIWWKFVYSFQSCNKNQLAYFFLQIQCLSVFLCLFFLRIISSATVSCPCLPRWLSGLRHSAHRPERSAGGAEFNPRVGR